MTADPASPRRRFQFRLRTLLLAVTLIGVWTPLLLNVAELIHATRVAV